MSDIEQLIVEAKDFIKEKFDYSKHSVGAVIKTASGKTYRGVNIRSQKLDLCSEWVPVGQAIIDGEQIVMGAAVRYFEDGTHAVYAPCALCRELYVTYAPEALVVINETEAVKASLLLPHPWVNKHNSPKSKSTV